MGFGSAAKAEKLPAMALIGILTDKKKESEQAGMLVEVGADGVLVDGTGSAKALADMAKRLDGVPWGPKVSELVAEKATSFREAGCDFLAFGPEKALLGALEGEDTAFLLCIEPDMEERSLRAIEDLPVDGVLLPSSVIGLPVTVQHLIDLGTIRGMFSKYLFLELPGALSSRELEGLRDLGVDAVVVNPTILSREEIEGMLASLKSLPKKQRDKTHRADAVLPRSSMGFVVSPAQEEEDDDDDYADE